MPIIKLSVGRAANPEWVNVDSVLRWHDVEGGGSRVYFSGGADPKSRVYQEGADDIAQQIFDAANA